MSSEVRIERPGTVPLNNSKPRSRVTFKNTSFNNSRSKDNASQPVKRFRADSDRPRRKRTNSCSFSWDRKKQPPIILPSKFLLGGNIGDPLNLEALKEEVAEKEISSGNHNRGGGTVRVIIPPNINDPLNLDASSEDGEEQLADAIYRQRRRRKSKKRKRRNSEPGGVTNCPHPNEKRLSLPTAQEVQVATPSSSQENLSLPQDPSEVPPTLLRMQSCPVSSEKNKESTVTPTHSNRSTINKKCRSKTEDKIVSPVIPQPGVERKKHHIPHHRHPQDKPVHLNQQNAQPPTKFNPRQQQFRYGNYNQYYGYRNPDHMPDPRLKYLKREWFENKTILDIGCNIGHISLCIARDFGPRKVFGIDIDKKLIKIAQKNTKHYVQRNLSFPKSMEMLYGSFKSPLDKDAKRCFPHNVSFSQANYVLEDDRLLPTVRPEFDVILCLSVTKWVHLNWGDSGLKRFFKRIFNNLHDGGLLILEPQAWPSYTKRRKLSAEIFENYKAITLFPERFGAYLLNEVGFVGEEKLFVHHHFSKGFRRPIYVYRKPISIKAPEAIVTGKDEAGFHENADIIEETKVSSQDKMYPHGSVELETKNTSSHKLPSQNTESENSEADVSISKVKDSVVEPSLKLIESIVSQSSAIKNASKNSIKSSSLPRSTIAKREIAELSVPPILEPDGNEESNASFKSQSGDPSTPESNVKQSSPPHKKSKLC